MPHLATCMFLFFYNEPELSVGIDPGMALKPLPSRIGQGSNPRPSDHDMLNKLQYPITGFLPATYPR